MEIVVDATESQFQATLDALDPSVDDIRQALGASGFAF